LPPGHVPCFTDAITMAQVRVLLPLQPGVHVCSYPYPLPPPAPAPAPVRQLWINYLRGAPAIPSDVWSALGNGQGNAWRWVQQTWWQRPQYDGHGQVSAGARACVRWRFTALPHGGPTACAG
jgi:hypothetical protein